VFPVRCGVHIYTGLQSPRTAIKTVTCLLLTEENRVFPYKLVSESSSRSHISDLTREYLRKSLSKDNFFFQARSVGKYKVCYIYIYIYISYVLGKSCVLQRIKLGCDTASLYRWLFGNVCKIVPSLCLISCTYSEFGRETIEMFER
jgi:hypothetical protein